MLKLIISVFFVLFHTACEPIEQNALEDDEDNTEQTDLEKDETGSEVSSPSFETDFERPPYLAVFRSEAVESDFVLIGAHLKPDRAVIEANWLDDVHKWAIQEFEVTDAVILGDLNLSCGYASSTELAELDMKDETYHWAINDDADTNTAESSCAYDRIVTAGSIFDDLDGVVQKDVTADSDHYPIYIEKSNLRIGAFNLKQFGDTKASRQDSLQGFASIICEYDIILLQEIRDQDGSSVDLLDGKVIDTCGDNIQYSISASLGSTTYKERYLYYYNTSKVTLIDAIVFPQNGLVDDASSSPTESNKVESKSSTSSTVTNQSSSTSSGCCKVCKTSKACGDSCISKSFSCNKPKGCACNETTLYLFD